MDVQAITPQVEILFGGKSSGGVTGEASGGHHRGSGTQ